MTRSFLEIEKERRVRDLDIAIMAVFNSGYNSFDQFFIDNGYKDQDYFVLDNGIPYRRYFIDHIKRGISTDLSKIYGISNSTVRLILIRQLRKEFRKFIKRRDNVFKVNRDK